MTGTFHCTFFCSAKTIPTWQQPAESHRNERLELLLQEGRRHSGCAPHTAPHSPAAPRPGTVTAVLLPTEAIGALLGPRVLALGEEAQQEGAVGHKGTFVEELHLFLSGGRCEGSPRPAPAEPQPPAQRAPQQLSPPGSRTRPGCGIRGQIRRRLTLATQMSWIGKWGWGEETDPDGSELGFSLQMGALEGVGGCRGSWGLHRAPLRSSSAGTGQHGMGRGHQEESGSCLSGVGLILFIFPSATGTFLGLQFPVPMSLHPLVRCSCLSPCRCIHQCSDQRCSSQMGTSLLGAPWLVC